jgi:hypothetical protein
MREEVCLWRDRRAVSGIKGGAKYKAVQVGCHVPCELGS